MTRLGKVRLQNFRRFFRFGVSILTGLNTEAKSGLRIWIGSASWVSRPRELCSAIKVR